jgi:hypothetical protein
MPPGAADPLKSPKGAARAQPYEDRGAPPSVTMPVPNTQANGEFGLPDGVDGGKPAQRVHGKLYRAEGVNPGRASSGNFHKDAPHRDNFPKFSGKRR